MKTLIIGMGALGGLIAARLRGAGLAVWLATRDAEQADRLRASGLRVTGMGGSVTVQATCRAALKSRILRMASSFLSLKSRTVRDFALKSRTNFLPPKGSGALNCSRLQDRWKTGILTLRS